MNKIIVFGNCLQNTVGIVHSIGEKGYPVDLLLEPCKKSDCYIRFSKYINKIFYLSKIEDAIDILLKEYSNEREKSIILCGSDPTISLLDRNYNLLEKYFLFFNANATQGRISYYLNKRNTFEIAERCGLSLIKTVEADDPDRIPEGIEYPCFAKGSNSVNSNKGDIHICYSKDELQKCMRKGVKYLIQEYIKKDYEINIIGFSYNHGKNIFIPGVIRKLRDDLVRMGEFMRLDDTSMYPNVNFSGIKNLIAEIGYEGVFSVEFLCKNDKYYFLETNLRNDALTYIYTAAGANYPYLWVKYVTGNLTDADIKDIHIKTPFYVMHENDLIYNIAEKKVSLWQWIKDFIKTDGFLTLNKKDPMPFIVLTFIHIRQLCKKILRKIFKTNIRL